MSAYIGAQKAALARQMSVQGEEILIDGEPVQAMVNSEEVVPEIGPDGEPIHGIRLTVTVPNDAAEKHTLDEGLPFTVRGRSFELASFNRPSVSYNVIELYRR